METTEKQTHDYICCSCNKVQKMTQTQPIFCTYCRHRVFRKLVSTKPVCFIAR